jgi:exopolysaccharide production protein ExoZ
MMVVWHSCLWQMPGLGGLFPFDPGAAAVDIFFVISGFVIAYTTASKPISAGRFFALRVIRVVPLYWVAMLLWAALQTAPSRFGSVFSLGHLAHSLAFIPYDSPRFPGKPYPLFTLGGTLNYEMFFYALFALSLWVSGKWRMTVVGFALCGLVAIGLKFGPFVGAPFVYTDVRLLGFLAGMMIAWMAEPTPYLATFIGVSSATGKATFALKVRGDGMLDPSGRLSFPAGSAIVVDAPTAQAKPGWLGLGAAWTVGGIACLTFINSPWLLLTGSALIVAGSLSIRVMELKSRLLLELGNASYSIYLTHLFTLGGLRVLWVHLVPSATVTSSAVLMVVSLAASAGIGLLCFRFVERPLTAWMRRAVLIGRGDKIRTCDPLHPMHKSSRSVSR